MIGGEHMTKKGLGRGLGSLFDERSIEVEEGDTIKNVKVTQIEPNQNQPRREFDNEKMEALTVSIKEHGIIQPIIVIKNNDMYKIVAGERRWRAAKSAGLKEIPVVIRNYSDVEITQIALIENLQREDLNPIEEATGYQTLLTKYNMTQEDVSKKLGKSRSAIANSIRLLSLDDKTKKHLISGSISGGHARALLSVTNQDIRDELLESILTKGLNVRQTEALAKQLQNARPIRPIKSIDEQVQAELNAIEDRLSSRFGTKVKLVYGEKKGKIEIEYYGNDDLDRILSILNFNERG